MRFESSSMALANGRVPLDEVLARGIQHVKEYNPYGIMRFTIPTGLLEEGASKPYHIVPVRRSLPLGDLPTLQRGTPVNYSDEDMRKLLIRLRLGRSLQLARIDEIEAFGEERDSDETIRSTRRRSPAQIVPALIS